MKTINLELKSALAAKAKEILNSQINNIQLQFDELQSAGASESKSSAGDKYETQREMIKQTQVILNGQLSRSQAQLFQLNAVSLELREIVWEGALMQLSIGNIWVSISFGKIEMHNMEFQLISKNSPLFLALQNKKKGENVVFRGKKIAIMDLF